MSRTSYDEPSPQREVATPGTERGRSLSPNLKELLETGSSWATAPWALSSASAGSASVTLTPGQTSRTPRWSLVYTRNTCARGPALSRPTPSPPTASSSRSTTSRSACARSTSRAPGWPKRAVASVAARAAGAWRGRPPRASARPHWTREPGEAREVFLEQAEALSKAAPTRSPRDVHRPRGAAARVRRGEPLGAPVLAYKTFVEDGETLAEGLPARTAREISSWGADLTGANCTVGPQRMVEIAAGMSEEVGPVLPSQSGATAAGWGPHPLLARRRPLRRVRREARRGRGAPYRRVLGTTPAHVSALSEALRNHKVSSRSWKRASAARGGSAEGGIQRAGLGLRSAAPHGLRRHCGGGPAAGQRHLQVVEAARRLKERGVDAVDISDGARAGWMHPVAAARILHDEVGIETVAHISCRDRNLIGLQADLLGAAALGVKNILAVTGDPAQIGDTPRRPRSSTPTRSVWCTSSRR